MSEQAKMLATLERLRRHDTALVHIRPDDEAIVARWYCAVADRVEKRYGKPLPRNDDGMPLLFFPPGTRTREILRLAVHACDKAFVGCDAGMRDFAARGKVFDEWADGA